MTDISVNGLVKSFELGKNILDGLSFDIAEGERVGILGHNGCGKTTLFRILTGEIDYDEGAVAIASGKRLGLISQIPVYPDGWTTEDVLRDAHHELYAISARLDELAHEMEHDQSDKLLAEYDRLSADFSRLGGYDMDTDRNRVANGACASSHLTCSPAESGRGSTLRALYSKKRTYSCLTSRQTTSICMQPNGSRIISSTSREPFCL